MAESAKPPVGDVIALLLDSADCPASIRTAIINHLSELYEQSNLMSPHIVRMLYPMLQSQGSEAKAAEASAPKPAGAAVPFPLSVAPPVPTTPFPPVQPTNFPPTAPSASAPAANPFANRNPAPPSASSTGN
jgi:hypothetical protein